MLSPSVHPSARHKLEFYRNGDMDWACVWQSLSSAYPTLSYTGIQVASKIRVLPFVTLFQILNLADFSTFPPQDVICLKCCQLSSSDDHHSLSEWTSTPPLFTILWAWSSVKQFVCNRWDLAFRLDALPDAQQTVSNHWTQWDADLLVCQHQLQAARCRHCSASCCYLSTAFGREVVCLNQQSTVKTAHVCVHMIVHNCSTQYGTEKFWLPSLLSSRQSSLITRCPLEGRVSVNTSKRKLKMRFFGQWWMSTAAAVSQATVLLL